MGPSSYKLSAGLHIKQHEESCRIAKKIHWLALILSPFLQDLALTQTSHGHGGVSTVMVPFPTAVPELQMVAAVVPVENVHT